MLSAEETRVEGPGAGADHGESQAESGEEQGQARVEGEHEREKQFAECEQDAGDWRREARQEQECEKRSRETREGWKAGSGRGDPWQDLDEKCGGDGAAKEQETRAGPASRER